MERGTEENARLAVVGVSDENRLAAVRTDDASLRPENVGKADNEVVVAAGRNWSARVKTSS